MPRREQVETEGGLSEREQVITCYAAYRAASAGLGRHLPEDIGELDEELLERVINAVGAGRAMLFEVEQAGSACTTTWKEGAGRVCHELGIEEPSEPDVLCAEALLRHLSNALDFDTEEDGDIGSHEEGWKDWAAHQAALLNKGATRE